MKYRIDRDGNGTYRVCWRPVWWPLWFTVTECHFWDQVHTRLFQSCEEAREAIASMEEADERARQARRWTKGACA